MLNYADPKCKIVLRLYNRCLFHTDGGEESTPDGMERADSKQKSEKS